MVVMANPATSIGLWARRVRLPDKGMTLWHLVESEISDRLVMRCGREMRYRADLPWEFTHQLPSRACWWCHGRAG